MAWFQVEQAITDHPKTYRLADFLDIPLAQAIGHMVCLWAWALDYAKAGSLEGFTPNEIARAAKWNADPETFLKSLEACGWVDPDRMIHDWDQYAGKTIQRREDDAARKRTARASTNGHAIDEVFEAVVEILHYDPATLTPTARTAVGRTAKELRAVDADPALIRGFRVAWDTAYPDVSLKPHLVTKHWPDYMAGTLQPFPERAKR